MSTKRDLRRADLVVPFTRPPPKETDVDMTSTMSSTMPMAAMFTRNKMIGWVSIIFAVQTWLNETSKQKAAGKQPAIFSLIFGLVAVMITYIPQPGKGLLTPGGTGTSEMPAAAAQPGV